MKLEQQVVSLDLAKRLKELGVKQESFFYWRHIFISDDFGTVQDEWKILPHSTNSEVEQYSAFTVAELGEMFRQIARDLPDGFDQAEEWVNHQCSETASYLDLTHPDFWARMLVHLLENKLITV